MTQPDRGAFACTSANFCSPYFVPWALHNAPVLPLHGQFCLSRPAHNTFGVLQGMALWQSLVEGQVAPSSLTSRMRLQVIGRVGFGKSFGSLESLEHPAEGDAFKVVATGAVC